MKRIFVAVKVNAGDELLKMISSVKDGLRNDSVKWTHIDNIHITLVFLGDTQERIISEIYPVLIEKCSGYGSFQLILRGCGIFRSLNDPRIIWTGIQPSDKLTGLNTSIISGLKELNIKLEDRPFNPHLTVGRIKHINDVRLLESLIAKYQNTELQKVNVKEVILYESILLPSGPVYKPLAEFSLDKSY
jgi:RNA 2',3'-cyclic 3'-phosphodiesterase